MKLTTLYGGCTLNPLRVGEKNDGCRMAADASQQHESNDGFWKSPVMRSVWSPQPRDTGAFNIRVAVAAAFLSTFLIAVPGCSRRAAAITENVRVDAREFVQSARSLVEIESEMRAYEDILIAAARRAQNCQFGPLTSMERLANSEQRDLCHFFDQHTQAATKRLQGELEAHSAYMNNDVVPAWQRLATIRVNAAKARDAFDRVARKAQQTALALGTENRWFWLSALLSVAMLMAMVLVDRRHEVRRYLNGGQARALGLGKLLVAAFVALCLLTAALFVTSDGILVDLLEPKREETAAARLAALATEASEKVAEIKDRQATQQREVERLRQELKNEAGQLVPPEQSGSLFDAWWSYWQTAARRHAQTISLQQTLQRVDAMIADVKADDASIVSTRASAARWRRYASRISGVIGLGILGLIGAGTAIFLRGAKLRQQKIAATCPNCLAEGHLEEANVGEGKVRCANVVSDGPFPKCDFTFPEHLRGYPKLSFPTLGIPKSGKTFWLAMTYDRLTSKNYPPQVNFTPVPTAASEAIHQTMRGILISKTDPSATKATGGKAPPPSPLVFDFSDHDRFGKTSVLVNLFDYSGEVAQRMTLDDHQRRRAFNADGYLWFLDPLSDPLKGLSLIPDQKKALSSFESDVRHVKNLKAGQQLHRPIAICVPKIDLMINERYAEGGSVVEQFYADLGTIGWGMDEASIRLRSDLMRNLRDTIWPNWEIERAVDDLFGGRYMFFPLTPVGLDEPGQKDLKRRTIAPVGILHPLMWLLHMNGYPVLPRRAAD